jgi:arylsulfatase A-like enzyme
MNLFVLVLDSLRQDHVGLYSDKYKPSLTPNLDAFGKEAVVFENMYPEVLPTVPIRNQLLTGKYSLADSTWQPLNGPDLTIPQILGSRGYVSALIADTYHYFKPDYNQYRDFHEWRFIRGQEYDPYRSAPLVRRQVENHVTERMNDQFRDILRIYLQNTDKQLSIDDSFAAQVFDYACDWVDENHDHERKFLWVDCFDPHEPWDPPVEFDIYTDPDYDGPDLLLPQGGLASNWATPEQINYLRGKYAGEVAYVDHYVGKFLEKLRQRGHYDDSLIIILSDHGHPLAEHGKFLKGPDRMYNELLKVPFLMRFPGGEHGGQRTKALAQFPDFLPTIYDALGMSINNAILPGHSLMPVIRGEKEAVRDYTISGFNAYGIIAEAEDRSIRDLIWNYIVRPEGEEDELYNLVEDPLENVNLAKQHPGEAKRLQSYLGLYRTIQKSFLISGVQGQFELGGTAAR